MTRNRLGWSVVVAALTLLTAGPALAQSFPPTSFLTPAKATWESTRTLVLGIAELFPEDKYDFKPTPAVRTLRENLIHLIGENYFFFSKVSGETLPNNSRFNALKSRDEILKELRASYDYDAKVWDRSHRGKGAGARRRTEQPESAALVVHSRGDPGQHEPLRQPGRVRASQWPGAAAERGKVTVAGPESPREEDIDPLGKAARAHPPDGVAGCPRGRHPGRLLCGLGHAADLSTGPAIRQQLQSFGTMGSVLYVAAHPDDENTQVIAYLARGRGYRTAYLSLTRGDGGQNLLGPELREQLGVARTQELLAARRLDGGRQYFTRAIDFGFSKDYRETLQIWDRQAVLADIVRVIRTFRPDVIVTRFSPEPGPTHGHHTASVVLAVEAFKLAGDPQAFPEQLRELTPWQPKRIFHNVGLGGAGAGAAGESAAPG